MRFDVKAAVEKLLLVCAAVRISISLKNDCGTSASAQTINFFE